MQTMNRFGLCAFVISPLLMWGVPVLAKPPPNITESVAVCDPNSPSHCMAPSSSGGISLTGSLNLAPSGNAANAPVHFAFSTAASCYNVKLNPQNNHLLPIVMKHCFPLMDRLYALAEVERGYTLQYAANSLLNMYLDGILNSINPIYLVKTKGPVHSTIERKAGVINKWLVNDKDDALY